MSNQTCRKMSYSKSEAKHQVAVRKADKGRPGGIYFCPQHNSYHVSRNLSKVVPNKIWEQIAKSK